MITPPRFRKDSDNFRDLYDDNTTLFNRDSDKFLWDHWDGIAMFFDFRGTSKACSRTGSKQ